MRKKLFSGFLMRRGFTLVELLVVIVIISLLASMIFVGLNSSRLKARDTRRISDIKEIQTALAMYRIDNNAYPSAVTSGLPMIGPRGQTYMSKVPTAPENKDGACIVNSYNYSSTNNRTTYSIGYCLGGKVGEAEVGNTIATPGIIATTGAPPSTPPVITNTTPTPGNASGLRWTTDVPATTEVSASYTPANSGTNWEDYEYHYINTTLTTNHSHGFNPPSENYTFLIRATNADGQVTYAGPFSAVDVSCPYLFAFDGNKYNFITDISVSGRLGSGTNIMKWKDQPFYQDMKTNGSYPNPLSYIRISSDILLPKTVGSETFYDVRYTTELNETNYFDQAVLIVVDHASDVDVYADYRNNGEVHAISKSALAPASVLDQDGKNIKNLIAKNDNIYYHSKLASTPAYIDIKLSNEKITPENLKLVIKRGKEGSFVGYKGADELQYINADGKFVNVPAEYDIFNVVRPGAGDVSRNLVPTKGVETVVIDLSGLEIKDNTIRLVMTNNKRQWDIDWLAVDTNSDSAMIKITLAPYLVDLHARGISTLDLVNPADKKMKLVQPNYNQKTGVLIQSPLTGMATRYGDVTPLLTEADNKFVIMTQDDEMSLKYTVPKLTAGMERDFVAGSWNYHKPYIYALGDTIEPLPFNEMTQYPYKTNEESYPYEANREYLETYNTRLINLPGNQVGARSTYEQYLAIMKTELE